MGSGGKIAGAVVAVLAWGSPMVWAQSAGVPDDSLNLYGAPGLIDMPTARSAPDATLSFTGAVFGKTTRSTLAFQITPRLSGSFRYTGVKGFDPGHGGITDPIYYDRSFDLRYRLLTEGRLRPALAIGLRDFIGTSVYASEYVVATKSIGPRLQVTGGLGWGRLGSAHSIGSPFGARSPVVIGLGGKINYKQWFRGPMAVFGGVSWRASDRLTLKVEYATDAYSDEVSQGVMRLRSPLNFGASYKISQGAVLSGYYLFGTTLGVQLSFATNPKESRAPSGNEAAPLPVRPRPPRSGVAASWGMDWATPPGAMQAQVQPGVARALAKEGIILRAMSLQATRAEVRIENTRYMAQPEAIGRTLRVLTRALPASVETLVVTNTVGGVATTSLSFRRADIEALENAPASAILARARITDAAGAPEYALSPTTIGNLPPKFVWSLSPFAVFSLFDPDNPVRADFGLRARARYRIAPGLELSGSIRKKVFGNLDSVTRPSDSTLPHVRSDYGLYDRAGDPALENLTLAWYGRPGRNLYSRVTVGYLEQMYGGVSGEILWQPVNSRLALGAEVNYARQRDFNQLFGFQDYDVVTGHASAYYDFGNGFHGQLDVGRYLAGDVGATMALDREFANGWKVGAYATFTDVSAADFGEGSFDKGIRLTIPLGAVTGNPSRQTSQLVLRSLSRDGGARLNVDGRLYERVRDTHRPDLQARWGRFWR